MQDTAQIICPNSLCQTPNPENHRFCQQCRNPLTKRYLYALGKGIEACKPGKLVADRYWYKGDFGKAATYANRILLDTKPGFPPAFPSEVPDVLLPYFRLFPYQLHIPQLYGLVSLRQRGKWQEIWLLEQVPIYSGGIDRTQDGQLMPELMVAWNNASSLRQLNWLWQIAHLWQPLSLEGVASSLLNPELLRVEASLVRLLELQVDQVTPTLMDLGHLWSQLLPGAKPIIRVFLEYLCQQMSQDQLSSDQVVAELDQALVTNGRSHTRNYQIFTLTDTGPNRQRNEDACYPPVGFSYQQPLVIVCDGIGGHEGGNVASNLAIETVQAQMQKLSATTNYLEPDNLIVQLEEAICIANDRISQRNDTEQRHERQRMGTTLVMALAQNRHELYVAHVGDSRAYWITRHGCHQVTVDDDVASREARLGYAFYREALQQMGAGSLVQALGMNSSTNLHPTVQRFVLDEDCIFLLCSDGLSDNDRVEQYWETEILPVLEGQFDLPTAAARLLEIANSQNGHDNVTVGLIYCQVSPDVTEVSNGVQGTSDSSLSPNPHPPASSGTSHVKTQLLQSRSRGNGLWLLWLGIFLLLGVGGLIAYLVWDSLNLPPNNTPEIPTPSLTAPTLPEKGQTNPALFAASLSPGSLIQVKSAKLQKGTEKTPVLRLFSQPGKLPNSSATVPSQGIVATGSILQVLSKQAPPSQPVWLRLKVCQLPETTSTAEILEPLGHQSAASQPPVQEPVSKGDSLRSPLWQNRFLKPGDTGWIRSADLATFAFSKLTTASQPLGNCSAGASSTQPNSNP